ncbi:uncharacterized mitochondrial protein-like protein, partial [Tanacetum coccineum]
MILRTVLTRRPFNKITAANNSNFTKKFNTIKGIRVNTARPKAALSAIKGNKGNVVKASACWVWRPKHKVLDHGNPQQDLKDKGVVDIGCSRHMTGNKSYLTDYEEIDGGFVAFGCNPNGGKITRKVSRKDNMYSVDLKNVIPQGGLTCLFAKATPDESNLWHRKLGHVLCIDTLQFKHFRVFNSRTRIVEENMHVQFSENASNIARSGPNWLFNIDALTKSLNYKPVVAGNQSNGNVGTKACDDAGKARMETVPGKDYIFLPMEEEKIDTKDLGNENEASGKDSEVPSTEEPREDQRVKKVNVVDPKSSIELLDDPNMPKLEDIVYSDNDEMVYVDDIIFGSTKKMLCTEFKKMMHKKFQMSSMSELTFFLGLQVKQKEDGIFISQDKYVTEILKKFGFSDVKTASTSMETHKPLLIDADGKDVDKHMYISMIGSLMYLTSSRPDIMLL